MRHYAGLDVSVKQRVRVHRRRERQGLPADEGAEPSRGSRAGPSRPRLVFGASRSRGRAIVTMAVQRLGRTGLPVVCIETRHTKAFLQAQVTRATGMTHAALRR